MNVQNRADLAMAIKIRGLARTIVEQVRDAEEEKFDNMPESLQYGDRGIAMQDAINALEEACSGFNEVVEQIETASS